MLALLLPPAGNASQPGRSDERDAVVEVLRAHGGFCQSPSCGRPFVNVGRGSTRRYCSAACGTRERVAAYREARDSTSEAAAP